MSCDHVHIHAHPSAAGEASKQDRVLRVESQDREQGQGDTEQYGTAARSEETRQRDQDGCEIGEMEDISYKNQAEKSCEEKVRPKKAEIPNE